MKRRTFLHAAAGTAAATLGGLALGSPQGDKTITIQEPFPGAVLNRRLGKEVPGGLEVAVRGEAPPDLRVTVNGAPARREGRTFSTVATLRDKETEIVARVEAPAGPREDRVRVRWDRGSFPRYRFAIDDNSFFLRDIARKGYKSLFDCFYLKMLRGLHEKFKAKFVLNIYFRTDDGFELPQFSDRYRGEWRDNAGWLRLSFHALANLPDRPYQDAPVEKLTADFDKVAAEIHRFAGDETYTPTTVIHFGMVRPEPEVFRALAQRGVRVLSGYFENRSGRWDINYRLDDRRSEYLSRHDALMDFASGIAFSRIDIVCNTVPLDRIVPTLEPVVRDPNTAEIIDLLTHEQYFWPFYVNYLPDHAQRLEKAIGFVTEKGYKPVFLHEGFLGAPDV